jgi:hypothetical protein
MKPVVVFPKLSRLIESAPLKESPRMEPLPEKFPYKLHTLPVVVFKQSPLYCMPAKIVIASVAQKKKKKKFAS